MLIEANCVKRITASGGGTLAAPQNESLFVRDVYSRPSANEDYLTLMVQATTVAKWRTGGASVTLKRGGNHLTHPGNFLSYAYESRWPTLLGQARLHGIELGIPVAAGEILTVGRYAEAGDVALLYDRFSEGDKKADHPNGSKSNIRRFISYATGTGTITASPAAVGTSLIWSGGPAWPFDGTTVPEKTRFRLLGIAASPVAYVTGGANSGYTTFLQMIRRSTVLFDVDRNGLPLAGYAGATNGTYYTAFGSVIGVGSAENPNSPLWLDPPIVFEQGDSLTTQLLLAVAGAISIAGNLFDVAYILEQEYPVAA